MEESLESKTPRECGYTKAIASNGMKDKKN
jgi:hypothetical protein